MQTQVLSSVYESDQNVLVCAPPGSGKLGCAELSVLRCLGFGQGTKGKSRYVLGVTFVGWWLGGGWVVVGWWLGGCMDVWMYGCMDV